MRGFPLRLSMLLGTAAVVTLVAPGLAQTAGAQQGTPSATELAATTPAGDIVVTARRRSESLLIVPVAMSAITSAKLERQAITSAFVLSASVPSLQVTGGKRDGAI